MRCILRETSRGVGAPARVVSALTPLQCEWFWQLSYPLQHSGWLFFYPYSFFFAPEPWGKCSIPCSILAEYFFLIPIWISFGSSFFIVFWSLFILLFDPPPLFVHSDHLVRIQIGKLFLSPSDASEWLRLDNWQFWQTCTNGCAPGS